MVQSDPGDVTPTTATRRRVLTAAGVASFTGALATLFSTGAAAKEVTPKPATGSNDVFTIENETATSVYPQSVASGGPTPSGVIAWTRIAPSVYEAGVPLGIEVATDEEFANVRYRGIVPASKIAEQYDFTVNVDLHGKLDSDAEYYYRFVYDGNASRVGRCRTLPKPNASPDGLSLAVVSCNNYLHGYYGAFGHIADEDVDFIVHLGDFIYEYAGDGQQPGRRIELPSGHDKAWTLDDFRHLHKTYRGDEFMQRALEEHTLIHTWDDHEIVNNRWWNYDEDAPETESHPKGDDPQFMKKLYVEGMKAYTEYVPTRMATYQGGEDGRVSEDTIQEDVRLYRSVRFGDLCELFMTDERLYRDPPPKDAFGRRDTGTPPSDESEDPDRSMLGTDQRRWFVDGMTSSDTQWKLWGNEVFAAPLKTTNTGEYSFYLNYDAWDGYRYERQFLMGQLKQAGVENVVALTGDMHSYIASYLLEDYESVRQTGHLPSKEDRVGVEFMTPGVTSDNLAAAGKLPGDETEEAINIAVQSQNPHIEWFNSSRWGYTVVDINRDELLYTAYGVDRTVDSANAPKTLLRSYRVPAGETQLYEYKRSELTELISNVDGYSSGETTDGPDVFGNPDTGGGDGL